MKINELKGKALTHALKSERAEEWDGKTSYDGKRITNDDLIALSIMNKSEYDENGEFIGYMGDPRLRRLRTD